jgi:protocatechuate 3,4-dioxygenase beta subunit
MTTMLGALLLVIGVDQTPPAAPPRDPATQPVSAVISGLISEQGSGRPLPGALVTLLNSKSRERSGEVVADRQGRYEFTGLQPGEYTLYAGPGEMRATHLRQAFGQAESMDVSMGMPRSNIDLKPGEVRSDANIALARALAIEGRILDQREEPMADVAVQALAANGAPVGGMSAHSDDRGQFRLWGLAPGRYRVCATPQNRFVESADDTAGFVRTCHLASTSEAGAADVMLDRNDATNIDIRVQRAATYSVSGSVIDAAGALVDGGFVDAFRDDRGASASNRTQNGRFVLKGLPPGRYLLQAGVGGPANPGDLHPPARERELGYSTFVVDGSDLSGVDVQLSKGRTLAGRVIFEGGQAPRSGGLRIVVQTRIADETLSRVSSRPPFSPVNDDLEFELKELFQLPLVVGIHGQPDEWVPKTIRFAGRDIIDLPTNLGAAPLRSRLDIVLTNRVAAPSIRVTDEHGGAITSYHAVILPADPNRWKGFQWSVRGVPTPDGTLKLGPRLPGDYLVAAIPQQDYPVLFHNPARIESVAAVARRVTLVEGTQTVELRLTRLPEARQ